MSGPEAPLRAVAALVVSVVGLGVAALAGLSASGFHCSGGAIGEGCGAPARGVGWLVAVVLGAGTLALAARMVRGPSTPRGGLRPAGSTVANEVWELRWKAERKGWEVRDVSVSEDVAHFEVQFHVAEPWRPVEIRRRADGRVEVTVG